MIPWGKILGLLEQFGGYLTGILGIVSNIYAIVHSSDASLTAVEEQTTEIDLYIQDATDGFPAVLGGLDTILAQLATNQTDLLTAIAAAQQGGSPVTLPTVPPTGYGGASAADIAAAVWSDTDVGTGETKGVLLIQAGMFAENQSNYSVFQTGGSPFLWFRGEWNVKLLGGGIDALPLPDINDVQELDTVLSWLIRTAPGFDWVDNVNDSGWVGANSISGPGTWEAHISPADWNAQKATMFPDFRNVPPIYAGIDFTTPGTPVALAELTTISEECDGVLVDISSVAVSKPEIPYGDQQAWRYLGAIAFVTDDGHVEPWQQLAFQHALYCPTSIRRASGAVLRVSAGVSGTVTPWVQA